MKPYFMHDGQIIRTMNGTPLTQPSLMIDKETNTLVLWGEKDEVYAKYQAYSAMRERMSPGENDAAFLKFSNLTVPADIQCYILNRAIEYTDRNFIRSLYENLTHPDDWLGWIRTEMNRVPIDCSATDKE